MKSIVNITDAQIQEILSEEVVFENNTRLQEHLKQIRLQQDNLYVLKHVMKDDIEGRLWIDSKYKDNIDYVRIHGGSRVYGELGSYILDLESLEKTLAITKCCASMSSHTKITIPKHLEDWC